MTALSFYVHNQVTWGCDVSCDYKGVHHDFKKGETFKIHGAVGCSTNDQPAATLICGHASHAALNADHDSDAKGVMLVDGVAFEGTVVAGTGSENAIYICHDITSSNIMIVDDVTLPFWHRQ